MFSFQKLITINENVKLTVRIQACFSAFWGGFYIWCMQCCLKFRSYNSSFL